MWGLPWLGSTSTKKRPQFPVTVHCTRFYAGSDYRFSLLKSILSTLLPHGCLLDKNLDHYGFTRGSVVGIQLLWRTLHLVQQTLDTIYFVFYHCNWTTVNTQPQICLIKVHLKTHQSRLRIFPYSTILGFSSKGQSDVTVETKMYVLKIDPFWWADQSCIEGRQD